MGKFYFIIFVLCLVVPILGYAQCSTPFGVTFTQKTQTSIDFRWTDSNPLVAGWDVEVVEKGKPVSGQPINILPIPNPFYQITNLKSSTFYEIYIRTICTNQNRSNWNGPFVVSTVLSNPTTCAVNLNLKDNGTETFLIEVTKDGILGQNVFLNSVDFIVEHDWPADLKITLTNPSGKSVVLSNFYGTGGKHFGIPSDETCTSTTKFTDQACNVFEEAAPPFLGYFLPNEPLSQLHNNTQAKGIWKITFQDRANFHRGTLKYMRINLNEENCLPPLPYYISDIKSNSAAILWTHNPPCLSIKITLKEKGSSSGQEKEYFLNCLDEFFIIPDLIPETEYEIIIQSVCAQGLSQESCIENFKTNCKTPTNTTNFNQETLCTESCRFQCSLDGIWQNTDEDGQDWIVWQGKTDTENTGPDGDVSGFGKYIYMESQPDICGSQSAHLYSSCMQISTNADGCDLSFFYHMFGLGTGSLSLEISLDNGVQWTSLWNISGEQGNVWKRVFIPLDEYNGSTAIFRFRGETTTSALGDIALDQIEFYGSTPVADLYSFYEDLDNDGYGNSLENVLICRSSPPAGYVIANGDCDDTNPDIYPGQTERLCNLIDENCNGMSDDKDPNSTLKYTVTLGNERCKGEKNGYILLDVTGGIPPYSVTWNTGSTNKDLLQIGHGIYFCTISDAGSCSVRTDFFQILADQSIQYVVTNIDRPSCSGVEDGSIQINHSGGLPPFVYNWSNGAVSKDLQMIGEGLFKVTITDVNGCSVESNQIQVTASPGLVVGASSLKHPSCHDSSDGHLSIGVIDGTPPYHYIWSGGQTEAAITNLQEGIYFCSVTDSKNCQVVFEKQLIAPEPILTQVLSTEEVRCFGEKDGIIKTHTTGGTPPYLYFWNHSAFDDDLFDLEAGIYALTVTDKNACTFVLENIVVNQPEPLVSLVNTIVPATCISGKNGSIQMNSTGGIPPYHYSWNEFLAPDSSFIENLISDTYSVVVFDENGCKYNVGSIFVPYENKALQVTTEIISLNQCFNDHKAEIKTNVFSGSPPFDFNWSTGTQNILDSSQDTLFSLPFGLYSVTVTDSDGCTGSADSVEIPFIHPIFYQVTDIITNRCKHDSLGQISVSVSDTQGPFKVNWNNGGIGETLSLLPNGLYSAIIKDSAGCLHQILPVEISSLSNLNIIVDITNTSEGLNNGQVCFFISGGITPYDITWDEKITNFNGFCATELPEGMYTITVIDGVSCVQEVNFIIEKSTSTESIYASDNIFIPNPVSELLYSSQDHFNNEINIFDIHGKNMYTKPSGELFNPISVEKWASGMYMVLVKNRNKHIRFQKIIKF
ncbi:MAG: T9SS type A sorting domain-containing protein [Saprospiraceae bacterium]|nr:T9SS type A sorting domain-containing protein [Saprospiraceae bacterium]